MQSTTNYSMNLVEGTDIVNIPVQLNPNFQTIDGAMFDNKQASVGTATEVVTGTSHAIVRNNPDSDVFRFTATGAWTAGDTMSVDGNSVTVHLSDGTVPPTGAYIIGAEVLAVINSSLVTLMIGATPPAQGVTSFNSRTGAVVPTAGDYVAGDIDYDNTGSGLTATEVQSAIDEIAPAFTKSVTGTTASGLASAILALSDVEFIASKLVIDGVLYYPDSTLSIKQYRLTWLDDSVTYSSAEQIFDPSTAELNRYSKPVAGGNRVVSARTISSWTLYYR